MCHFPRLSLGLYGSSGLSPLSHRTRPTVQSQPGVEWQSQGSHPESCLPATSSHLGDKTGLIPSLFLLLSQNKCPQPIYSLQPPLFLPKLTLLVSNTTHNSLDFVPEISENKATESRFRSLGSSSWHRTRAYENFSPPHFSGDKHKACLFSLTWAKEHQDTSNFASGLKGQLKLRPVTASSPFTINILTVSHLPCEKAPGYWTWAKPCS